MPVAEVTEDELVQWGSALAATLKLPTCIALHGELGAGKTTLVRAIARALGVSEPVTSPTYALVHEYPSSRGRVTHVDLYRLEGPQQLPQLGWEEALRAPGLLLVEWPERAEGALPAGAVHLTLEHVSGHPELRRLSW